MIDKAAFRDDWRARRRDLSGADRREQSAAITGHLRRWYLPRARHRRVAVVMSYGAEPQTDGLRSMLHEAGVEVLVPVIEPARQLSWTGWHPGAPTARSSAAPIDEPVGERHGLETMTTVDVVVVPALVVDRRGIRMGQGGGYYDRFLAGLRQLRDGVRPTTLAMVFRHELLAAGEVPDEPFDEPVDGALTADGISWFGGPGPHAGHRL